MANWYYDKNGNKVGPISTARLIELAAQGIIETETRIENSKGQSALARQIPRLNFNTATPPPTTQTPPAQPVSASIAVEVNSSTVIAKNFCCNSCGTPLKIPKNSKGHVQCPSCHNDCVLEGLVKNAEIAAKENINSGIPLTASPAVLHRKIVSLLSESPNIPLDVFEKVEVVREERYCVPAYWFDCNGTVSFTYEVGVEKKQTYNRDRGNYSEDVTKTHTEWNMNSSNASVSVTLFASGYKKLAPQVWQLYMQYNPRQLMAIEELDFSPDVETYAYNLPQPASFNEYVKPYVEELLEKNAEDSLSGKKGVIIRNVSLGGYNIQKESVRIFLGLYHVVYTYGGKEYSIWTTGDGENVFHEGLPEDTQRQKLLDDKKQAMEQAVLLIPVPTTTPYTIGLWGSIGGGCLLAPITYGVSIILGIVGAIVSGVLKGKAMNPYNAQCADVRAKFQKEIDAFEAQTKNVVQRFKAQKKALRGIYAEVSGDAAAF